MIHNFEYMRPQSIEEAWIMLSEYNGSAILAGGTDLICHLKEDLATPKAVIDIKELKELKKIKIIDGALYIGALVTFTEIMESKLISQKCPVFQEMSEKVASVAVRNRATLAGNICSAIPSMDAAPILMAYDASIYLSGLDGERVVDIHKWFKAPRKTAIKKNELVAGISIPLSEISSEACFVKLGRYKGEDLAQVNLVVVAKADNTFAISFGAVGPTPIRARELEKVLNGQEISDDLIKQTSKMIPSVISPISDIRSSKEYRIHMAKVMFERGIGEAVARLRGNGTCYGTDVI